MINDELNTAFRWYNSLSKQNRFREYCAAVCDFALINPCDDLLPFQIKVPVFGTPTTWKVIYLDGTITIPETQAFVNYTPAWTAGTSFNLQLFLTLTGANPASKTYTVIGATSNSGALTSLASQINADVTIDFGATWNGTVLALTADSGFGIIANSWTGTFSASGAVTPVMSNPAFGFAGGVDATTGTELDISDCAAFVNKFTDADGSIYLTYNGGSLTSCIPTQLVCGKWYSTLTDELDNTYYSEVFEVLPIEEVPFSQIDFSLFSAWRFYDNINKQNRYKDYCSALCEFTLKTNSDALIPFMFRALSIGNITDFKLVSIDGDCENYLDPSVLQTASYLGYEYLYYLGADITGGLPCGTFYVSITDDLGNTWHSELIEVLTFSETDQDYLMTDSGVQLLTDSGLYLTVD